MLTEETQGMDLICAEDGGWPAWAGARWSSLCGDVPSVRLMWAFDCSLADAERLCMEDPCITRALAESPRVFMAWVVEDCISPEFRG